MTSFPRALCDSIQSSEPGKRRVAIMLAAVAHLWWGTDEAPARAHWGRPAAWR